MAELKSYKCPNCGGDLRFDPSQGSCSCTYCESRFDLEEIERLSAETEEQETGGRKEEQAAQTGQPDGEQTEDAEEALLSYSCPSCGAEIVTEESTAATFCYYCHNPVVLSGRMDGAERPDYVAPFLIDRKQALKTFEGWIRQKKFVPKAFYDAEQIEKFSGVYFPYLLYSCEVSASLNARARRVERSTVGSYENITTSVYQLKREGILPVNGIAKSALRKANRVLVEGVQPFQTERLSAFHPGYLSGFLAERKDTMPEEVREQVGREVRDYALSRLRASVAGYEDVAVSGENLSVAKERWSYALMPVWTMTYRDSSSDRLYYFSMNGQNGKVIGALPTDRNALLLYFLKIAVPMLAALLALSYFFL